MTKEELFNESRAELDVKIAQHKMGVRFTAHQMQTIRVAMANMNFAVFDLGGAYFEIAKNYNSDFLSIEIANQYNRDRGAYITGDISPQKLKKSTGKIGPPLVSGILKITNPKKLTKDMALHAYQQHIEQKRQQHQQNMAKLTAALEKVVLSQQEQPQNNIDNLTASLEKVVISQQADDQSRFRNK